LKKKLGNFKNLVSGNNIVASNWRWLRIADATGWSRRQVKSDR